MDVFCLFCYSGMHWFSAVLGVCMLSKHSLHGIDFQGLAVKIMEGCVFLAPTGILRSLFKQLLLWGIVWGSGMMRTLLVALTAHQIAGKADRQQSTWLQPQSHSTCLRVLQKLSS
jgi:hypothetical protein